MRAEAVRLTKDMESLEKAGDTANGQYVELQKQLKYTERLIKNLGTQYVDVDNIVQNLADTTKGKLQFALKACLREMNSMSANSGDLEKVRAQYEAITGQLKKLGVDYVNVNEVIKNIGTTSTTY